MKLDSSAFEAAQLMILNRISGLPVLITASSSVQVAALHFRNAKIVKN
jgi:hypothetical protein